MAVMREQGSLRTKHSWFPTNNPHPGWALCDILQEASSCFNVNTLLEEKAIFNLTMARPPVFCRSYLAYENPFGISLLLTFPNSWVYNQPLLRGPGQQLFLPTGPVLVLLIKPPFCTKDVSRILSWSLAPGLTYILKLHHLEVCFFLW